MSGQGIESGSRFPPEFGKAEIVLDYAALKYNPCDDLIFPSVIRVDDLLPEPLGRYYMYYSPHNAPGGICLAYADDLVGPWREYHANPLIGISWPPHYTVHHVASPHAIFVPEASRLFLYYHGDNDVTRCATSTDGIAFEYGGEAVSSTLQPYLDATSYARVFANPRSDGNGSYILLYGGFKVRRGGGFPFEHHGLYAAWSDDGRTWRYESTPILGQSELGPNQTICSPWLLQWKDRSFVLYHRDLLESSRPGGMWTDIWAVEVGEDLKRVGDPQLFCSRLAVSPDNPRIGDPCPIVDDGKLHLFASVGARLHQKIALLSAGTD